MKALTPLLFFALCACAKEPMTARYNAECDRCFVEYQADDRNLATVKVEGRWDVFPVDTLVVDSAMVVLLDSTRILGQWSYTVDLEHNTAALLRLHNASERTPSVASVTYGGKRKEAMAQGVNESVWAH